MSDLLPGTRAQSKTRRETLKHMAFPERRIDHTRRKHVSAMTREELIQAILTDHLTGLLNRRAFEERTVVSGETIVMIDADNLKYVNTTFGHGVGDELLRMVAALLQHIAMIYGGKAVRLSGDEFILVLPLGNDVVRLRYVTDRLQFFSDRPVGWEDAAGVAWALTGLTVTYGVGPTLATADAALLHNKGLRQRARLRASRGERPIGLKVWRVEEDEE